ncbi:triphosphoribosyl-dephospho-CoA synthase [Paenibacillus piscarius]|uniref:triphosphoribosyl-dephospho-CoA synthase n=1 Tax=Paenibacillus piscarius TaxID=1089681 RepID=UPI001EE85A3F|nr:triphosphoribosyl-dephospho-CoA synthase [Paenibacillus piscarius]
MTASEQDAAAQIAEAMTYSLLSEAVSWPSPGLVSAVSTGCHRDMDIYTFLRSALRIQPYYREAALFGMEASGGSNRLEDLFQRLQRTGQRAEADMLTATGGVNTHKGTIFLGMILCAAAGMASRGQSVEAAPEEICRLARSIAERPLQAQLAAILEQSQCISTGARAYREWGVRGIRGEVIDGFPSILNTGLPSFREALDQGADLRTALVHCLLSLMSVAQDTTLLNREFDRARIHYTQSCALEALARGSLFTAEGRACIRTMEEDFRLRSLSPGGSADLLAMTYTLYLWNEKQGRRENGEFLHRISYSS